VRGEVRFSNGDRAIYSTDASNYRQLPIGAVVPRDARDVIEAIGVCHRAGVPVLARGVGTSLAGQTCNTSVVLDHRHAAASEHGLNFGLDPASLIVPRPERASRFWPEAFGLATWIRRHA
jgi:FAD/FMN-containing dehydrogenase